MNGRRAVHCALLSLLLTVQQLQGRVIAQDVRRLTLPCTTPHHTIWTAACVRRTSLTQVRLERAAGDVAILYSYFEKDDTQKENFAFFLTHGIGSLQTYPLLRKTEVVVVNNGYMCSPCTGLPIYNEKHR